MIGDCPSYFACVRLEIIGERYAVVLSKSHDPIPQGVIREPRARHEEWKVLRLRERTFVYEPYDISRDCSDYAQPPTVFAVTYASHEARASVRRLHGFVRPNH